MKSSFSRRVALAFMGATAILTMAVFLMIYWVVYHSVYSHLEDDLNAESLELFNSIVILSDQVVFANPNEWLENEHGQIEVNPTFIQYADSSLKVIKKSSNLLDGTLVIIPGREDKLLFSETIGQNKVYQLQTPVRNHNGQLFGYLSVAVPLDDTVMVLRNLRLVLLITFPLVLLLLYFISDVIAGNSIAPVYQLTETARKISGRNTSERIPLPSHRDELYTLAETINSLVDRLQAALLREKQFTADASHELRTPLAVLRGNFELTLRKNRSEEYYREKLKDALAETNRMSSLVDQLLLLARYDQPNHAMNIRPFSLLDLINDQLASQSDLLDEKQLHPRVDIPSGLLITSDRFMFERIVENLLSNAVKYSFENGSIIIRGRKEGEAALLEFTDEGQGIPADELERIFERFYRVDSSRNKAISGNGLGLSLVKRFTELLKIELSVKSTPGEGTVISLLIPQIRENGF
ncbi:MAG: sensor histidine kinase [Bacteroidota bacterium]